MLAAASPAGAQSETLRPVTGVGVHDVTLMRDNDRMKVEMQVDLSELEIKGNRAVLLTPCLTNGSDTVDMWSVGVYSRRRWYYYQRNDADMLSGPTEKSYRKKEKPAGISYRTTVPYEAWMDGSELVLTRRDYGCCAMPLDRESGPLAGYKSVAYEPEFRYVQPVGAAVKSYSLSGRAFIDFPVNRTELFPDYRGNRAELAKIIATIDSVRNDRDVTVTALSIKGFASPEGTYANNVRLARGRTEALRYYVQTLYRFPANFIATDYEPEDWAGLREYVEGSYLPNRSGLLAIIDDPTLQPDPKEWRMKTTYPADYKILLNEVYPGLRHSDYQIAYTVRSYTTPEEIREVLHTAPQKLSLNEMYVLAQSLEPGSEEYNEVFETAVRMFPDDPAANLNAANAAMMRKDYASAERYLGKAGRTAETVYAQGVLAALQGDYGRAEELVREAGRLGMADTGGVLEHLQEVHKYHPDGK